MITIFLRGKGIIMNSKKVLRIMGKYNLLSKLKKKNPYKNISKATQEHRTCNNVLARDFSGITQLSKIMNGY